jgi:hypothetical protein
MRSGFVTQGAFRDPATLYLGSSRVASRLVARSAAPATHPARIHTRRMVKIW